MNIYMQFLFAFLGLILFILMGMQKTFMKHGKEYFKLSKYLIDDAFELAIAIVSVCILIPALDEIMILIDTKFEILLCAFVGFSNVALWNKVVAMFKSKKFLK